MEIVDRLIIEARKNGVDEESLNFLDHNGEFFLREMGEWTNSFVKLLNHNRALLIQKLEREIPSASDRVNLLANITLNSYFKELILLDRSLNGDVRQVFRRTVKQYVDSGFKDPGEFGFQENGTK